MCLSTASAVHSPSAGLSYIFKNHGKLNVHFVGLSASTANFASYSTAHITIDTVDLYLDNKYSMGARFVVTSLCQPIIKNIYHHIFDYYMIG